MLSAEQLRLAAASDQEALEAAQSLSRKQRGAELTLSSARPVLIQNLCDALTRTGKHHKEALLVGSIVQRFFMDLPLRLLVILLGGLLPLLRHCHAGNPSDSSIGQNGKEESRACSHHAHHGEHQF